jgi:hypothetical protein
MGKHRNQPAGRQPGDGKPGYKNIGKAHQWKKGGPSPNPAGRGAKKSPSLKDELHQILVEVLKSSISAGDRELTVMEAVLRRMMVAAVNDPKLAIRTFPMIVDMLSALEPKADAAGEGTSDEDAALLAEALRRLGRGGASV